MATLTQNKWEEGSVGQFEVTKIIANDGVERDLEAGKKYVFELKVVDGNGIESNPADITISVVGFKLALNALDQDKKKLVRENTVVSGKPFFLDGTKSEMVGGDIKQHLFSFKGPA